MVRYSHEGLPDPDQDICLALAFNRNAAHTDTLRVKKMEENRGFYVITCAHNREANDNYGMHHLQAKFGNRRFIQGLLEHFAKYNQTMRVKWIVLDWFWMQSGGDGPGGWITGYLSGTQTSESFHLLAVTIPTLFETYGLQDVFLPMDNAGVMFRAILKCQDELQKARAKVEFVKFNRLSRYPDENPLYLASMHLKKEIKESSREGLGPDDHIQRYCHPEFPFVRLLKADATWSAKKLEDSWEVEIDRASELIEPEDFSRAQITRLSPGKKRMRRVY